LEPDRYTAFVETVLRKRGRVPRCGGYQDALHLAGGDRDISSTSADAHNFPELRRLIDTHGFRFQLNYTDKGFPTGVLEAASMTY